MDKIDKTDVHRVKQSHMSTPLTYDFQWHLQKDDYPDIHCKLEKEYMVLVPMRCTSIDEDSYRFVVTGKVQLHDVAKGIMDTFKKAK